MYSTGLYYLVEQGTSPGLYDNLPCLFRALAGSPAFRYTVFPGIEDASRAWAKAQCLDAVTASAWDAPPLEGSWSIRCNRPFETVDTEDLYLFSPPVEEPVDAPPPPAPELMGSLWPADSAYITPPPSPAPSLRDEVPAPPAPPPSPSVVADHPGVSPSPGLAQLALPTSATRGPPASPRFQPAFDGSAPAEVLVLEETRVETAAADEEDTVPTYDAATLVRQRVDSAPKGQAYFAVTRGYRVGLFTGPYERISPLVAMYHGAHFCGFAALSDAAAWFLEHALD
ncbi:hypothetical protein FA95DRAFT_1607833 [Auriscalpium vulgare]|uniref:Uncharacterized protein n=1 Tax=Auriscalpium vulgare TaxID=40419 RepID=A0ACB8RNS2_9AGAM|nr:hypothetical protein FA95DRAFT_1607833 [Auriscalpium vulgare]